MNTFIKSLFLNSFIANLAAVFVLCASVSALAASASNVPAPDAAALDAPTSAATFSMPNAWMRPYLSIYHVDATQSPSTPVVIRFYVTDFNHSKIRLGDSSHRFNIRLRYSSDDGASWKERILNRIPSGDAQISLGTLPVGDYVFSLEATDSLGRHSHVIWHEFRVRDRAQTTVAAKLVTDREITQYGINKNSRFGSLFPVEVGAEIADKPYGDETIAQIRAAIDKAFATAPAPASPDGYIVITPAHNGTPINQAWRYARILYGSNYNARTLDNIAEKNTDGLQRLIDDAYTAKFTKVVLPKGFYLVSPHTPIRLRDGLTLDLNGSTVKMNAFTGSKALVFEIRSAIDAHLVNGTIEGDYFEHDYANSPNNSEWVMGVSIVGDSRYSSLEDLNINYITGYGAGNGLEGGNFIFGSTVSFAGKIYTPGAINPKTGEVNPSAPFQFTSDFRNIYGFRNKYITVSKYLGYQGIRTKTWNYTAAFYDTDKKFISAESAHQYRIVRLPKDAAYMRITIVEESLEKAQQCELSGHLFRIPWNCTVRNLNFFHCRAVGYAPAQMRNMLIENCSFRYSGQTLAKCAFDAEDGWDGMQDVTLRNNTFSNNPMNDLLCCAGQNFTIENNKGHIYLWGRVNSPCVRNNDTSNAGFHCDSRTRSGYARIIGNTFRKAIRLGMSGEKSLLNWDYVIDSVTFAGTDDTPFRVNSSATGRFRNCTFDNVSISGSNFDKCTFKNAQFSLNAAPFRYSDQSFANCTFANCNQTGTWERCTIKDCSFTASSNGKIEIVDSSIARSAFSVGYWSKPISLIVRNCDIDFGKEGVHFLRIPFYSIDHILFEDNRITGGKTGATIVDIYDLREQPTDHLPGTININRNSVSVPFASLVNVVERSQATTKKSVKVSFDANRCAKQTTKTVKGPLPINPRK